ncbi:MAG TPA: MscL family protein [Candidatus Saccharimonadales bacterium]|jgi:large-conductance mechanosensitive channel
MAERKGPKSKSTSSKKELPKYSYRSANTVRAEKRQRVASATKRAARRPVSGFAEFLRERAVVGLAVGFVLGTQVQTVVKQFISSFVDPLFQLLFSGNKALSSRTFTLHFDGRHANFGWGEVAYALLDFLFVAATIYVVIKIFKLDKLDKKK